VIPAIPRRVAVEMARRRRRFHQYLWHRVRNSWLRLTEGERRAVQDINPAWAPSRPALDSMRRPMRENDSGEDFLFMHRCMIDLAKEILSGAGDAAFPRVEGWRSIPPPGDADYPVPEFPESELEEVKSAEYCERVIAPWEARYKDPDYLRGVTLGQLGSDLQFTIHCAVHVRWAAPSPVGYRPSTTSAGEIGARWDAPKYDYLGDTYSSHVNPIFWKIHGWMDDRVEDWKRAHGISGEIEWKGTWLGAGSHELYRGESLGATFEAAARSDVPDDYYRIDRIISASAASEFDGFFRPPARRPRPTESVWPQRSR
jgi:hypothetical protein